MQNLVYEWVNFSKFGENWLKFKKMLEKIGNSAPLKDLS